MDDPKNIRTLFEKMEDIELPSGYDARFFRKLEDQNDSSWVKKLSFLPVPTNFTWAAALGSFLFVSLSVLRSRNEKLQDSELAVNDEIEMLDDLDTLLDWDEGEKI